MIRPGIYRHYKGNLYRVIGIAHHSETLEELVVYQALYESPEFGKDAIWVRPIALFCDMVDWTGKRMPRFTFVGPEAVNPAKPLKSDPLE